MKVRGQIYEEYFKSRSHTWIYQEADSAMLSQVHNKPVCCYTSNLEALRAYYPNFKLTVTVRNISNMGDGYWSFHIDNEDMQSIARFDVRTFEDANRVLLIYGMRLDKNCGLPHLPEWNLTKVMAEQLEPLVRRYAKESKGYYPEMQVENYKEWRRILGRIIFALAMWRLDDDIIDHYDYLIKKFPEKEAMKKWEDFWNRMDEGMALFGKYFGEFYM